MKANQLEYQINAVQNLSAEMISFLCKKDDKRMLCTLKAPTGSGKTYMASQIIEKISSEVVDVSFVWLSIGTGNIHMQSKESLERYYGESPRVRTVEYICAGSQTALREGEVLVVNWEKIRTKDKQGEWKNIVMKDGDNINFREILDNTKEAGMQIVLVIDESHLSLDSERGKEIVELMQPTVVLEISATPKIKDGNYKSTYLEEIKPQDVIDSGMIKDQIIINETLAIGSSGHIDSGSVLMTAFGKRKELKYLYEQEGTDVNPLVLIQVVNADEGEEKIEEIRIFLANEGITTDNGKLAIWLSEDKDKVNLIGIKENNAPQEFLIFKEALATGWDCPRAQILVKYRDTKSEIFKIQVIGRILRMPEQRHYTKHSVLNKCYIYTNQEEAEVDIENYSPNILGDLRGMRDASYESLRLLSYYRSRADYQDIKSDFHPLFNKALEDAFALQPENRNTNISLLKKQNFVFSDLVYMKILEESNINTDAIDAAERLAGSVQDVIATDSDISMLFSKKLKEHIHPFTNIARSVPSLASAWYKFCGTYLFEKIEDSSIDAQKLFLNNQSKIIPILKNAVKEYKEKKTKKTDKERDVYKNDFEIKDIDYFSSKEYQVVELDKNLLQFSKNGKTYCYLQKDRSDVEKNFEKHLSRQVNIKWWYKNGVLSAEYFGIRYEYDNKDGGDMVHTMYPDYLVQYIDGRIGIFETKHTADQDGQTKTKAKAEALSKYIKEENKKGKNLIGGIVVYRDEKWQIHRQEVFDLYGNGWEEFEKLY